MENFENLQGVTIINSSQIACNKLNQSTSNLYNLYGSSTIFEALNLLDYIVA